MKTLLYLIAVLHYAPNLAAQNVGIGTTTPDKAKLMVVGTGGASSNTVALFGTNAGISIQQAWPTIGFNQYRDGPTGNGRAISTGYGMHFTFNYGTGDFTFLRNGWAEAGNSLPQQGEVITFIESGYRLKLNSSLTNGIVDLPNKVFTGYTGKMNLVPLGVIYVDMDYFPASGLTGTAANKNGALQSSYLLQRNGTQCRMTISLNPSQTSGYNDFILVPGLNFTQANSGNLFSIDTQWLNESPRKIQVSVLMSSEASSQFGVNGNILVYGVLL